MNEVNILSQKEQEKRAMNEDTLEDEIPDNKSFGRSKLLKVYGTGKNRTYAIAPTPGKELRYINPDPIDEILIDILEEEKKFDEIITALTDYFEDGNTSQGKKILIKLLRAKLRKGIYRHLYEVRMRI